MLGVIIIPGNIIIIEEGEQLVTVLLKALFVMDCYFTLIIALGKLFVDTRSQVVGRFVDNV